jgi:hypothetical protein
MSPANLNGCPSVEQGCVGKYFLDEERQVQPDFRDSLDKQEVSTASGPINMNIFN